MGNYAALTWAGVLMERGKAEIPSSGWDEVEFLIALGTAEWINEPHGLDKMWRTARYIKLKPKKK